MYTHWLWIITAFSFRCFSITPSIIFSIILLGSENDRPRMIFLPAFLKTWDLYQLSVDWDLSRYPRPLKNNWEILPWQQSRWPPTALSPMRTSLFISYKSRTAPCLISSLSTCTRKLSPRCLKESPGSLCIICLVFLVNIWKVKITLRTRKADLEVSLNSLTNNSLVSLSWLGSLL